MRKPIIAGNWKMNLTPSQGVALVNGFISFSKVLSSFAVTDNNVFNTKF